MTEITRSDLITCTEFKLPKGTYRGEFHDSKDGYVGDLHRTALGDAWEAINVLGAPDTAITTDDDRRYQDTLNLITAYIESLQIPVGL